MNTRQPIIIIIIVLKPMATIYKQKCPLYIYKSPSEHIPWLDLLGLLDLLLAITNI